MNEERGRIYRLKDRRIYAIADNADRTIHARDEVAHIPRSYKRPEDAKAYPYFQDHLYDANDDNGYNTYHDCGVIDHSLL